MERPTHKDNVVKVATLCLKEHSRRQQEEDGGVLQSSLIQHRLTLATYTEHERSFRGTQPRLVVVKEIDKASPLLLLLLFVFGHGEPLLG